MRRTIHSLVVAAMVTAGAFAAGSARAQVVCDFITGGGTVQGPFGGPVNFGVDGGCRQLAYWGSLNLLDKAFGPPPAHLKSIRITAYFTDPTHMNARHICGEGEVVQDSTGNSFMANFHAKLEDNAGAGPDRFGIRITQANNNNERYHMTMRPLERGNIERHKDNSATLGPGGVPQCNTLPPDDFPSSPVGVPVL